MKKYGILFMTVLMLLSLVACISPDEAPVQSILDLNGFHYVFNEAGEYVWLGMTRQEVERIVSLSPGEKPEYLVGQGVSVQFDESGLVYSIFLAPPSSWSIRGDLSPGSYIVEIEDVFNMNYVYFPTRMLLPWLEFYFSFDHIPVEHTSDERFYRVQFSQVSSVAGENWEGRIATIFIDRR